MHVEEPEVGASNAHHVIYMGFTHDTKCLPSAHEIILAHLFAILIENLTTGRKGIL